MKSGFRLSFIPYPLSFLAVWRARARGIHDHVERHDHGARAPWLWDLFEQPATLVPLRRFLNLHQDRRSSRLNSAGRFHRN
jgi:hypothetical protein